MSVSRSLVRASAVAIVASLALAGSVAATRAVGTAATIRIDNFGKVSEQLYRGAQPSGRDYADLAALGVKTVLDLRDDADAQEPGLVKRAGMQLVRIPMSGWDRPADAAVAQFLKVMNESANLPVFVHCKVGKHRTGAMVAVYRMTRDSWTAAQAYTEMQKYHFDVLLTPHTALKTFVFDYYTQLQKSGATAKQPIAR
jgi:protein tyrosine/serine phosphatase